VPIAFRDDDALRVALMSGLCPPEVQAKSARVARGVDGGLVIAPDVQVLPSVLAKMKAAGIDIDAKMPPGGIAVKCWAEAIAPVEVGDPQIPAQVLLVTQTAADLVDLAAELLRLGCDRQEMMVGDVGVIRAVDPPTYSVVRALDHERGMRAYAADPPNQDAVWVEIGFRHPLADRLRAESGHMLLVSARSSTSIASAGWVGLDAVLDVVVPGRAEPMIGGTLPARRRIELRLVGGRRESPSLWVIRQGGVAALDRLLDYLPEDIVARLVFAAVPTDDAAQPIIVLRARTSRHPPPDLALPGAEEYAPLHHMPDLYAPAGSIVEPPLRRERLRSIIGIDAGQVVWLAATHGNKFRVEKIADSAFAPLSEWADYVIHASAPALVPWLRAVELDLSPFVSTGIEWGANPSSDDGEENPERTRRRERRSGQRAAEPAPQQVATPPKPVAQKRVAVPKDAPVAEVAIDAELAALEAEFVALDAPGDAPERIDLLERLGRTYARLGRRRDAGLCFTRAVWEAPTNADADERLDVWITSDVEAIPAKNLSTSSGGRDPDRRLVKLLEQKMPDADDVRLVAVIAARAGAAVKKDPHRITRWLDDHDGELDARTTWLARLGLARVAGGDQLGMARARDRILARLAGGLPVERELPAFLRLAGRTGALGNASGDQLDRALDDLANRIATVRRKRSPVEAPVALTQAYASFQLAHGFARIGRPPRARLLVAEARKGLAAVANDPVHAYLIAAFAARVDQALAGEPAEAPLPEPVTAQLAALDRVTRYKVDRLREVSRILEPVERLDAIGAFSQKTHDSRGPEFVALRALVDPNARVKAVAELARTVAHVDADNQVRLIDGIFDVLLELPESGAAPILATLWPLIGKLPEDRQAVLLAEALVVAGHFGRTELVPELLRSLGVAIRSVTGGNLERVLDQSLRALRRIGLRQEIADLLAEAEKARPAAAGPEALRSRLALASGLAYLGDAERAMPIYDQARQALNTGMTPTHKLELTRSLAMAYSQAPLANALGGITELAGLLPTITDSFGTNSHYCLSVLHFVESLVLGIASDDLALGEAGRRFVEDDEHLIRRRLHRDLEVST
jgi:hypothetical protein